MLKETRAVITVLVGATLLSSMGVWGRAIYSFEGNPMTVVTWRALIGAASLAAVLSLTRPQLLRIRSRDLPFFALYGFIGVTMNFWAYFSAFKFTTLAVAITLLYTFPAFVALLSAVLRNGFASTCRGFSSGCWQESPRQATVSSASAPWDATRPGLWFSMPLPRVVCSWR